MVVKYAVAVLFFAAIALAQEPPPNRISAADMCEARTLSLEEERAQLRARIHELEAKLELCSIAADSEHSKRRDAITRKYGLEDNPEIKPDGTIVRKPAAPKR
jgi:hypothetical protein